VARPITALATSIDDASRKALVRAGRAAESGAIVSHQRSARHSTPRTHRTGPSRPRTAGGGHAGEKKSPAGRAGLEGRNELGLSAGSLPPDRLAEVDSRGAGESAGRRTDAGPDRSACKRCADQRADYRAARRANARSRKPAVSDGRPAPRQRKGNDQYRHWSCWLGHGLTL
jgi:hypothetical protein